jgi:hypothetical protein
MTFERPRADLHPDGALLVGTSLADMTQNLPLPRGWHEQIDHHNVKPRCLENVNDGMSASRKRCVGLVPGQDGLYCGTDARLVVSDENSRYRFNEIGHLLSFVQVYRTHRAPHAKKYNGLLYKTAARVALNVRLIRRYTRLERS